MNNLSVRLDVFYGNTSDITKFPPVLLSSLMNLIRLLLLVSFRRNGVFFTSLKKTSIITQLLYLHEVTSSFSGLFKGCPGFH